MKILVAVDGSDHAWKALELAIDIAKVRGGELLCLHVTRAEPMLPGVRALAQAEGLPAEEEAARLREARQLGDELTREAERRARAAGLSAVRSFGAEGSPPAEILALAKDESVDMIAMGSRGRKALAGGFLRSISRRVASHAPCTCVLVR
jgi:nucleotide-binding universal stress UspA family protein